MIERATFSKTWKLLDSRQKRSLFRVVIVMLLSAAASAAMVASIFPFLSLLSDPGWADQSDTLTRLRTLIGLTDDYALVFSVGILAMALIVLGSAMQLLRNFMLTRFCQFLVFDLSRSLLGRYLAQPYIFAVGRNSASLATNVLSESERVVGSFFRPMLDMSASALTLAAVLGTVITIQPVLGTAAFAFVGAIYGIILLVTRRRVRQYGRRRAAANEARYRISGEAFGGFKDIKLLVREAAYVERFSTPAREMAELGSRVAILVASPRVAIQGIVFAGIILFSLLALEPDTVGTGEVLGGLLPALGVIAFAAQRALPELATFYGSLTQIGYGAASVDRIADDFEATASAPPLPATPPTPVGLKTGLRLEDVRFSYPGADQAGLHGVTLDIRAGERIGVVGATGAGKTTLADILLGLLRPQSGRIVADGVEIDEANLRGWHRTVSYVPQDIFLTDATLAENIALGIDPDAIDRGRVERCARLARLHGFVEAELPQRYDTMTGERGVRLSGGQRQRVGIARALYHEADLIVLDEATSALDNLTEREVIEAIEALPGDKTLVMVAHRLTTLRGCDRILVMERGRVVADGAWQTLVEESPVFRAFARHAETERLEATG